MSKELFISASPHETKVAVLEDDQLVEVYYERDTDVGLVGGIYKGRVSRVLPGMQSAFVDIGLERDAFLYVSDFFEDAEEYDKIVSEAESRVTRYTEGSPVQAPVAAATQGETPVREELAEKPPAAAIAAPPSPEPLGATAPGPGPVVVSPRPAEAIGSPPPGRPAGETPEFRRQEHRGRRRRRRGGRFGAPPFASKPESRDRPPERHDYAEPHTFEVLPGESLAKYSRAVPESSSQETPPAAPPETGAEGAGPTESTLSRDDEPRGEIADEAAFEPADLTPAALPSEPPLRGESFPSIPAVAESTHLADQSEAEPQDTPEPPVTAASNESPAHPDLGTTTPVEPTPVSEVAAPVPPTRPAEESTDESSTTGSVSPDSGAAAASAPVVQSEEAAGGTPPVQAPPPEASGEPAERRYALREPHQRPRFAPRRGRRGRRGKGQRAVRPEGGPSSRHEPSRPGNNQPLQISELLKEGQEILVQIAKEPLGRKGARITSHIALPGRYLVSMPTVEHIGVSRKIASEEERLRLRNIILENRGSLTGGFIVRTAGEGRAEEEFKADLKFLSTLWSEIRAKAERTKAPALLHRDLDLVQRILRDTLSSDFKSVRTDSEIEYERILELVNRCQPALVGKVKLYTRDTPLFEEFGIQAEIDKALKSKVWLKSGGYIVINQTEALVAIDVNTGKYVGKTNRLEDTIVKTNIDAVNEIVRQIRLRDLGGIIVIDFIDMDERRNRNKVVQALEEALRHDRAPTKILSFNDFGLVALTRKRVKHSLERTLCEPCNYCAGSGWIKSVTTICYDILAEARKMASEIEGDVLTLRVNPEVAHALKSREGALLSELESLTHKDVVIKSDPTVHQERFEIY